MRKIIFVLVSLTLFTSCIKHEFCEDHNFILMNATDEDIVLYPEPINVNYKKDSLVLKPGEGFRIACCGIQVPMPTKEPDYALVQKCIRLKYCSLAYKISEGVFFDESKELGCPLNLNSYTYVWATDILHGWYPEPNNKKQQYKRNFKCNTMTYFYVYLLTEDYITSCERVGTSEE